MFVALPAGPMTTDSALETFKNRRLSLLSDDPEAWLSLGTWAIENDLLNQADDLYRDYLSIDPSDESIYEALMQLANRRELPRTSETLTKARAALPGNFREHATSRFIVLSDTDTQWTRQQAANLERAHHQLMRYCRRIGLSPLPLRHKLVCVLFERRDDYKRFAHEHDQLGSASVAGYYSPSHDWIVFYNPDSNPSIDLAEAKLDEMKADIIKLTREAERAAAKGDREHAESVRKTLAIYEEHYRNERDRVADFVRDTTIVTTVHEAIHQMLFHTRIQNPRLQYPMWLSEGLAAAFETTEPDHAFGPDHEYDTRRVAFDKLLVQDKLIPLDVLVQLSKLPADDAATAEILYQQSYAFTTWLSRFRKSELRAYLELMQKEVGRPSPREHRKLFVEAFGDVEQLERTWLRYESIGVRERTVIVEP